uniref:Uncharacterized protein n=1 Tax=Anguilla anguilla TaxID=7936 RepID=A0A0E9WE63_ANGAN
MQLHTYTSMHTHTPTGFPFCCWQLGVSLYFARKCSHCF